jgi:hypothetical protein
MSFSVNVVAGVDVPLVEAALSFEALPLDADFVLGAAMVKRENGKEFKVYFV